MVEQAEQRQVLAPITWEAIEAEAGNYKAGFVALFRKYEGRPIVDESGEPVMSAPQGPHGARRQMYVSRQSFAERLGIPSRTFYSWVKLADTATSETPHSLPPQQRLPKNPEGLVDVIERASSALQDIGYDTTEIRTIIHPKPKVLEGDVEGSKVIVKPESDGLERLWTITARLQYEQYQNGQFSKASNIIHTLVIPMTAEQRQEVAERITR